MLLNMKKRISNLLDTMTEYLDVLCGLTDKKNAILDCLAGIEAIQNQLEQEESIPQVSLKQLHSIKAAFHGFRNDLSTVNEQSVFLLKEQVLLLKALFQEEVKAKLKIVFLPYKISMWDSLESIYEAASKDPDCEAHVVPIPYYQLSQKEAFPTYEGDRFPQHVPVVHYTQYNLAEQQPDVIFVHNIYDEYNSITRVYEEYFTSNLKNYTDMLVYVPYHLSSFVRPDKENPCASYNIRTVPNVNKIILGGEYLKEAAVEYGVPEEKLLALGSPKLDAMVKGLKSEITYPPGWKEKLEGKTVYLINTGCTHFAIEPFSALESLLDFLHIPLIDENSAVIWRPHPLTMISIIKYTPDFLRYFLNLTERIKNGDEFFKNVILDETDDYIPALKAADVLISKDFSLLRSYLLTEKKVLFWDEAMPENSLIPDNAFYFAYNRSEPWYELVKKFPKGYDPLAENRKGLADRVYANTDGTAGEKVYQAIKVCVLKAD